MTNYSTAKKVKSEAGLENNDDIAMSLVQQYLDKATAIVKSMVGQRYSLPAMATNFDGSVAQSVLRHAEELLAAGNLLNKEYGYQEDGTGKGDYKIDDSMKTLQSIADGSLTLFDSNDSPYPPTTITSRVVMSGFPNSSTDENQDGQETDRSFTLSKEF